MLKISTSLAAGLAAAALAGCATVDSTGAPAPFRPPIVAGAVDSVGVTAGVGAQNQGGNLTVGYKGAKFALVPVQDEQGRLTLQDGPNKEQSFSVFALLGVDAKGGLSPEVDIRQVVAVGPAADIWAFGASGVTSAQVKAAQDAGVIRK